MVSTSYWPTDDVTVEMTIYGDDYCNDYDLNKLNNTNNYNEDDLWEAQNESFIDLYNNCKDNEEIKFVGWLVANKQFHRIRYAKIFIDSFQNTDSPKNMLSTFIFMNQILINYHQLLSFLIAHNEKKDSKLNIPKKNFLILSSILNVIS